MKVSMSRELLENLYEQAVNTYPEEECGLLAGLGDEERLILGTHELENGLADERLHHYCIPTADYRRSEQVFTAEGLEVAGVYHSHTDGSTAPSDDDVQNAWPWFVYLILGTQAGKVTGHAAWVLRDDRSGFAPVDLLVAE